MINISSCSSTSLAPAIANENLKNMTDRICRIFIHVRTTFFVTRKILYVQLKTRGLYCLTPE